jgi:hypothetical protein
MAMLRVCTADGCETKTLGLYCVEHERDTTGAGDDLNQALKSAVEREIHKAEPAVEPSPLDPRD